MFWLSCGGPLRIGKAPKNKLKSQGQNAPARGRDPGLYLELRHDRPGEEVLDLAEDVFEDTGLSLRR